MGPVPSAGTHPLALRLGQAGGFQDEIVRGIPLTAQGSPDTPRAGVSGGPARCCCYTLTNVRDASGTAVPARGAPARGRVSGRLERYRESPNGRLLVTGVARQALSP
jgi:hypothetical protein